MNEGHFHHIQQFNNLNLAKLNEVEQFWYYLGTNLNVGDFNDTREDVVFPKLKEKY